jgi:hypothetical protein
MDVTFSGEIIYWRGPSPFYFVPVPDQESAELEARSAELSYGWGCIPVTAHLGRTRFTTSLFPKDGLYLLPLKLAVRRAEDLDEGDLVEIRMIAG